MIKGTVKFYNEQKGFGFIEPEDGGKDVFVHASAIERAGLPPLNEGDKVTFEIEDDRRGRDKQAANEAAYRFRRTSDRPKSRLSPSLRRRWSESRRAAIRTGR